MFTTPGGKISFKISPSSNKLRDVWLEGLITTVQPAARAGANFQAAIRNGKFQGTTWPTTPIGSRTIRLNVFSSNTCAEPSSERSTPAK